MWHEVITKCDWNSAENDILGLALYPAHKLWFKVIAMRTTIPKELNNLYLAFGIQGLRNRKNTVIKPFLNLLALCSNHSAETKQG
jgi:hypothetical protein